MIKNASIASKAAMMVLRTTVYSTKCDIIVLLHVSTVTFKIAHYNLNTAFDKQKNIEEDYVMAYSHYMKNRTATSLSMTNWWLPSDCVEFFPIW